MSDIEHTPQRLVAAAERLFVAGGEEATSLRAIAREARSNAAAVHYHFGGRDQLLRAVLERHLGPVHARRAALLDAVEAGDRPVAVPVLVAALVRPELELLWSLRRKRLPVARFLGRTRTSAGPAVAAYHRHQWEALCARVVPLLAEAIPGVGETELRQRLGFLDAAVAAQFCSAGSEPAARDGSADEQIAGLVAFGAAGLVAPPARPGRARTVPQTGKPKKPRRK